MRPKRMRRGFTVIPSSRTHRYFASAQRLASLPATSLFHTIYDLDDSLPSRRLAVVSKRPDAPTIPIISKLDISAFRQILHTGKCRHAAAPCRCSISIAECSFSPLGYSKEVDWRRALFESRRQCRHLGSNPFIGRFVDMADDWRIGRLCGAGDYAKPQSRSGTVACSPTMKDSALSRVEK